MCRARRSRSRTRRSRRRRPARRSCIAMCATPRPASRAATSHLYREVTERIRDANVDVVLNLTAGMGGDMVFGSVGKPAAAEGTGHRHGRRVEPRRACPAVPAGNLHARLRHDEFRRSRLCDDQHARHAARHGRHDDRDGREAGDRGLRHRASVVRQAARVGRRAEAGRAGAALHGRAVGRAGRSQHLHGDGQQRAVGLDMVGLLARPQPDGLCRGGGACRRQCPRRARGQSLARQGRARHQRAAGRAGRHDRREHGRAGDRAGRGAQEAQPDQARACWRRRTQGHEQ